MHSRFIESKKIITLFDSIYILILLLLLLYKQILLFCACHPRRYMSLDPCSICQMPNEFLVIFCRLLSMNLSEKSVLHFSVKFFTKWLIEENVTSPNEITYRSENKIRMLNDEVIMFPKLDLCMIVIQWILHHEWRALTEHSIIQSWKIKRIISYSILRWSSKQLHSLFIAA